MDYYGGTGGGYPPAGGMQQTQQPPPPPQAAPPPPPPAPSYGPKKSKIGLLILVFAILAVIFMGISLMTPWYKITNELDDNKIEYKYYFSEITYEDEKDSDSKNWDDDEINDNVDNQAGVFTMTMIMVILGLVFSILFLIGGILSLIGKGKKLAMIFGLLAFIFCLLAPILFMALHPGAVSQDSKDAYDDLGLDYEEPDEDGPYKSFMGSHEEDLFGMKIKSYWGPGAGWIHSVIAFVFALIGFILVLKQKKSISQPGVYSQPQSSGPGPFYQQQPPQQQYGPPPQQQYGQPPPQQQYGQPPKQQHYEQRPPQYPQY